MELVRGNGWIKALAALAAVNMCQAAAMMLSPTGADWQQLGGVPPMSPSTEGIAGPRAEESKPGVNGDLTPEHVAQIDARIRADRGEPCTISVQSAIKAIEVATAQTAHRQEDEDLVLTLTSLLTNRCTDFGANAVVSTERGPIVPFEPKGLTLEQLALPSRVELNAMIRAVSR